MSYVLYSYLYIFIFKYAVQYIFFSYTHICIYINTYLYIHRHMIYIHACIYTSGKGPFVTPFPRFETEKVLRESPEAALALLKSCTAEPWGVSAGGFPWGWVGQVGKGYVFLVEKICLKLKNGNSNWF